MSNISTQTAGVNPFAFENLRLHNDTTLEQTAPLTVKSDPRQWSYAIGFPIPLPDKAAAHGQSTTAVISLQTTVHQGVLGALIVGRDSRTVLTYASARADESDE